MYGPLRQNPIACAIGTKTSTASVDPMLQLGIWTVAWYRRMDALWHTIHQGDGQGRGQVVSLPLISIVDQQWSVYFAVDRGDHIVSFSLSLLSFVCRNKLKLTLRPQQIFGPQYMGSTGELDAIYMLHTSLGHVREWTRTVFHEFLVEWFGCKDVAGEGPQIGV